MMKKFKVKARNTTVPEDQTLTFSYGYQDPWKTVTVRAVSRDQAIRKSKSDKLLPTRIYVDHQIAK